MFNIEEKIKKWYEKQKNVPIVKNQSNENEEVIYTTSNNSTSTIKNSNQLKDAVSKNQKEYDRLKSKIVYEYDTNPNHDYSDKSLEEKAEKLAREEFATEYNKEDIKNKNNVANLDYKKFEILYDKESKEGKINDNYKQVVADTTDKAIKNGVSRSSIYEGEQEKNISDRQNEIGKLEKETETAISNNDKERELENLRYENAVEAIDDKKDEVKEKVLKSLKNERQELIDKGVIKSEFDAKKDLMSPEMIEIRKKILNDVLNYYLSMDKDVAVSEYEKDTELHKLLGDLEPTIRTYITGKGNYYR